MIVKQDLAVKINAPQAQINLSCITVEWNSKRAQPASPKREAMRNEDCAASGTTGMNVHVTD